MATARTKTEPATEPEGDDDKLEKLIDARVGAHLGELFSSGKADVTDDDEKKDKEPADKPLTMAQVEAKATEVMDAAVEKLKKAMGGKAPEPPPEPPQAEKPKPEKEPEPLRTWREKLWGGS